MYRNEEAPHDAAKARKRVERGRQTLEKKKAEVVGLKALQLEVEEQEGLYEGVPDQLEDDLNAEDDLEDAPTSSQVQAFSSAENVPAPPSDDLDVEDHSARCVSHLPCRAMLRNA